MKDYKKWVYHAEHEAIIINASELDSYLEEGWVNSPAELPGTIDRWKEALNEDGEDKDIMPQEINAIAEACDFIADAKNFMANVDKERSKKKIIKFLNEWHNDEDPIEIPPNASLKELRALCHEVFS